MWPYDLASQVTTLETHGPLGILWIGIGLGCFYIALVWINLLLGHLLTPLFLLTASHLFGRRRGRAAEQR